MTVTALHQPRQQSIPGTEPAQNETVAAAALEYVAIRDQRMALTKREKELKQKLLETCLSEKVDECRYFDADADKYKVVKVTTKQNVRVRNEDSDDDEDGDDE